MQGQAVNGSVTYLLTQGVLGICVIGLVIAVIVLWRKLQAEQAARLTDSQAITREVVNALNANTQSTNVLNAKIETGKRGRVM